MRPFRRLALLALWTVAGAAGAEERSESVVLKDVMVQMRDGVRLATDVYLPARNGAPVEGRFPAILERTPYDKDQAEPLGRMFVHHRYVFVAQDVRDRKSVV